MSRLLNIYNNLKKQNSDIIYLFKNGVFYLALEDDAKFLSHEFNLKLVSLNSVAVKCGFPCASFDKYYIKLKSIDKEFKIVDTNTISDVDTYLQNKKIKNLLCEIQNIDVNNLSVSNAFAFIERINATSKEILGGTDEF